MADDQKVIREIIDSARAEARQSFVRRCNALRGNESDYDLNYCQIDREAPSIAEKILFGYGKDTSGSIDAKLAETTDFNEIFKALYPVRNNAEYVMEKESSEVKKLVEDYVLTFKRTLFRIMRSPSIDISEETRRNYRNVEREFRSDIPR